MKCPKCSYTSFDYNNMCPKCNKDISSEQSKLNVFSFRPSPPHLLGALTGEADDSGIGIRYEEPIETASRELEAGFSPEDSQAIEAMEEVFEEGQDLEMQIEPPVEEEMHLSEDEAAEEPSLNLEDLIFDDTETGLRETQATTEDDIVSFDLDDLSGDETEIDGTGEDKDSGEATASSGTDDEKEEISLDLSDLSMEDLESEKRPDMESPQEEKDPGMDLDGLLADEGGNQTEPAAKPVKLDTAEMVTSEIDIKNLKESEGMEDFDLELDLEELDDK